MKKWITLSLLAVVLLPVLSFAQSPFERTYGGVGDDGAQSVQQTSDGGFIMTGLTGSFGAGSLDVYLIKTDPSGNSLWTRTYGGAYADTGLSVVETQDGGFVISGSTRSFSQTGWPDVYLIRTDPSGDTLWTKTYGDYGIDVGTSVQEDSDGGFTIAGYTHSYGSGGADCYLIRTDSSGNTLWTRTYGGIWYDMAFSMQETTDGGYVLAGMTASFGAGSYDVYLIKTDASGDTLWTRTYGNDQGNYGRSVQQTPDEGYIIAGSTEGPGFYDVYLIRTDSSGDTLWTRAYDFGAIDWAWSVRRTLDGGFVVAGATGTYTSDFALLLFKIDSSGDILWTRTYGGSEPEEGLAVQQTSDGGYVIAGTTESFGAGAMDVYLIKTDPNGLVGIGAEGPHAPGVPRSFSLSQNYPNPFNPSTRIRFGVPAREGGGVKVRLEVFDLRGRRVRTLVDGVRGPGYHEVHWDGRTDRGEPAGSGIYFYRIRAGEFVATRKMVVLE